MPTLTIAMIVKDEARNIKRCLESVRNFADEIIIGDTGSTDGTDEIARLFTPHVFRIPWHDDFSEARNRILEKATGDWIFCLDADEWVSPPDGRAVKKLLEHTEVDAWQLEYITFTNDRSSMDWIPLDTPHPEAPEAEGWTPMYKAFLFRNKPGIRFQGKVHETVEAALKYYNCKTEFTTAVMPLHLGHLNPKHQKYDMYIKIAQNALKSDENDPRRYITLASDHYTRDEFEIAETYLQKSVQLNPDDGYAWFLLGNCQNELHNYPEAIKSYLKAIHHDYVNPAIWNNAGNIHFQMQNWHEAITSYDFALNMNPMHFKALMNKGITLMHLKNYKAALQCFSAIVKRSKQFADAYLNMGYCHTQMNQFEKARTAYRKALSILPTNASALVNLANTYYRLEKPQKALKLYEKALALEPERTYVQDMIRHIRNEPAPIPK